MNIVQASRIVLASALTIGTFVHAASKSQAARPWQTDQVFKGTVRSVGLNSPEGAQQIIVGFDASWCVVVYVDEAIQGSIIFKPGQTVVFLVHSPALLFREAGNGSYVGKQYRFHFTSVARDATVGGKVELQLTTEAPSQ